MKAPSLIKSLVICLTILGICNSAARSQNFQVGDFFYKIETDDPHTVSVIGVRGFKYDEHQPDTLVIPPSVKWNGGNYTVTKIRSEAFYFNRNIVGWISLPETVKSIEEKAFYCFWGLKGVKLPSGISRIEPSTFKGCENLAEIDIPMGVVSIGEEAFWNCPSLQYVTLSDSLEYLGKEAFCYCENLEMVHIPSKVREIGSNCFFGCDNLDTISVSPDNPYFSVYDGILYDKTLTRLIFALMNIDVANLPEGLTAIPDYAFTYRTKLRKITFPKSLVSIGDYAFYDCYSLNQIQFNEGLREIGEKSFSACYRINEVIRLPEGLQSIGNEAFSYCSDLKSLSLPSTLTSMGPGAFSTCRSLEEIIFADPAEYLEIPSLAFQKTAVATVNVPEHLNIRSGAFLDCEKLTSFNISAGNPYLVAEGSTLFNKDKTALLEFPTARYDIKLYEGLLEIGDYAFYNNQKIGSITIPSTITDIGLNLGYNCRELYKVVCLAGTPPNGNFNLVWPDNESPLDCPILVPAESIDLYKKKWPQMTFYPIKENGVESVLQETDSAPYTVYSLDGRLVTVAPDNESLNALPSGIYIVNGKKMIVP